MTCFSKTKLHIATIALVLAASAAATSVAAQGLGVPLTHNLDFPHEGAFKTKSGKCFLFICPAKPQVTKNSVTTKLGEKS